MMCRSAGQGGGQHVTEVGGLAPEQPLEGGVDGCELAAAAGGEDLQGEARALLRRALRDEAVLPRVIGDGDPGDPAAGELRGDLGDVGEVERLRSGERRGDPVQAPLLSERDRGRFGRSPASRC
jgi:hypothetical protein